MIFGSAAAWFWLMGYRFIDLPESWRRPRHFRCPGHSLPIVHDGILIIVIFRDGLGDKSWLARMWCVLPIIVDP